MSVNKQNIKVTYRANANKSIELRKEVTAVYLEQEPRK